jgi:hypothetical protein
MSLVQGSIIDLQGISNINVRVETGNAIKTVAFEFVGQSAGSDNTVPYTNVSTLSWSTKVTASNFEFSMF